MCNLTKSNFLEYLLHCVCMILFCTPFTGIKFAWNIPVTRGNILNRLPKSVKYFSRLTSVYPYKVFLTLFENSVMGYIRTVEYH